MYTQYNLTQCDDCNKEIHLIDYYNQDGLCKECFKSWIDKILF